MYNKYKSLNKSVDAVKMEVMDEKMLKFLVRTKLKFEGSHLSAIFFFSFWENL